MPFSAKIDIFASTNKGLKRRKNEDAYGYLLRNNFFLLADGMGGHRSGDIASAETIRYLLEKARDLFSTYHAIDNPLNISENLKILIEHTNHWIYHLGKSKNRLTGMGTTLCTILFYHSHILYSHVGDSRIYQVRNGKLKQLTTDHTLKNSNNESDLLKNRRQQQYGYGKILTQAIGTSIDLNPVITTEPFFKKDLYLLCSDGLTDLIPNEEIEYVIKTKKENLKEISKTLERIALSRGGHDNITMILARPT